MVKLLYCLFIGSETFIILGNYKQGSTRPRKKHETVSRTNVQLGFEASAPPGGLILYRDPSRYLTINLTMANRGSYEIEMLDLSLF